MTHVIKTIEIDTEPMLPPYLQSLNEQQREAVETLEGPLLVLAGAGTGKTRVLTTRIAHILGNHKALPSQILAVTFTNKASYEMRERISSLIGRTVEGLWLGTFHSLCVRILRRHAERINLKTNFTILDTDDSLRLIKQIQKAENIDDKKWPPRAILGMISLWKDRGLGPDQIDKNNLPNQYGPKNPALTIYPIYQERLRILNAVDFGDLLLHCLTLFTQCTDILDFYQHQFRYILVDEYQDTNIAQYLWLRLLAQGHKNICCVGDDDQSIYGWRGAEIANILKFEHDFPGAHIIRLEQNYRSTPHILGAASGLIAKNTGRLGKTLWTEADAGEKVFIKSVWDGEEEARYVGDEIEALQRNKFSLSKMAILVRASHQTREFEERLLTLGIPYRVIGGPRFYERLEIRDALAYLRLINEPNDSLAFERIINTPKRGMGSVALQNLHHISRSEGVSLMASAYKIIETDELRGQTRNTLANFLKDVDRWRQQVSFMSPSDLAKMVLDESGYTEMWQRDKSPDAPGRLENLKELVVALEEFETIESFLDHVSLVMENSSNQNVDSISIMTLHSAKGLEFDIVFLAGWEEGLFPHQRSLGETGLKGLEEERRLAYVGLTRARQRAYIIYAVNRKIHGSWQSSLPSRFIGELPKEHVDSQTAVTSLSSNFKIRDVTGSARYLPTSSGKKSLSSASSFNTFEVGTRVFHIKFGYGQVIDAHGDKVDVDFEHSGLKKVITSFLEKA